MGELVIDEVMNPGDILYVPARMSHFGVAESDCLTFSFGLRYPNLSDILDNVNKGFCHNNPDIDLSAFLLPLRLAQMPQSTGKLGQPEIQAIKAQFIEKFTQSLEFDRLFQQALAQTVTSRRYEMLVSDDMADPDEILDLLQNESVVLTQDNNCKLAYLEQPELEIYANGEWLDELNPLEKSILKALSDGESLDLSAIQQLADEDIDMDLLLDSICNWVDDGWVVLR